MNYLAYIFVKNENFLAGKEDLWSVSQYLEQGDLL